MRRPFLLTVVTLLAAPLAVRAASQEPTKPTRVVFQVSDADPMRWTLALNNIRNLQQELGADNVAVELVAYGPGIGMLKLDASVDSQVSEAVKAGVAVKACQNSMRGQNLAAADMHPGVTYVAAGVVEIVKRQQDGWAYVRP